MTNPAAPRIVLFTCRGRSNYIDHVIAHVDACNAPEQCVADPILDERDHVEWRRYGDDPQNHHQLVVDGGRPTKTIPRGKGMATVPDEDAAVWKAFTKKVQEMNQGGYCGVDPVLRVAYCGAETHMKVLHKKLRDANLHEGVKVKVYQEIF